jgi:mannose-1-phosphate guanylyltransferase
LKAFLLAGGYGTRLRPLTDAVPKCLLPIQGKPLLDIWLGLCARFRITEVLINLHAHWRVVEKHLAGKSSPVTVRVVYEKQLLGSAGTIAANRDWIASDPAFWIFYADVLTTAYLPRMTEFHYLHGAVATVGLYQVPDPSRCGVALTDSSGIITGFEEKPKNPLSNWVFSGLMLAGPRFLDFIPTRTPADIAFDVLPHLLGNLQAYHINDYLLDIGTMSNYRKAQNTWPGMDVGSVHGDNVISAPLQGELSARQALKLYGGSF